MVEGFRTISAKPDQGVRNFVWIMKHILRGNAQDFNVFIIQPLRSALVPLRTITEVMGRTIHFDREFCRRTVEVEHIFPDRMLPPKIQLIPPNSHPQKFLGQRKFASGLSRPLVSLVASAHR
jgi:hypothetical protein